MTPKELDYILRRLLGSHKIPVDTEEMWLGVQTKMKKRKRKLPILVLFSLGIILTFLTYVWISSIHTPESTVFSSFSPHHKNLNSDIAGLVKETKHKISLNTIEKNTPTLTAALQKTSYRTNHTVPPSFTQVNTPNLIHNSTEHHSGMHNTFSGPDHPLLKSLPLIPLLESTLRLSAHALKDLDIPFNLKKGFKESVLPFRQGWSLGFSFSYGKHKNSFNPVSDPVKQYYQKHRILSESGQDYLKAGISLRKYITSHIFASSGLFLYRRTDIYSDTIFSIEDKIEKTLFYPYIDNKTQAAYPVNVSLDKKVLNKTIYRVYNNYSGFRIPFILGYSINHSKNHFLLAFGGTLQYRTNVKGFTTYDLSAVKLSEFKIDKNFVYPDNLHFSILGKLLYERDFSEKTRSFAGLSYERSISNLLTPASGLRHYIRAVSFEGGFRYVF